MSLRYGNNIYYYNRNIKEAVIGFLNLFTDIKVGTYSSETGLLDKMSPVPILFGPIERSSFINSKGETVQRTVQLPLLQFELTSMELDKTRAFSMKSLHIQGGISGVDTDTLMPYPYNFTITMNIYAKYMEDISILLEQILGNFNYHVVYYRRHPIFPEEITLPYWAMISTYPNFSFNYEYSAEQRRDILSVPITFQIEGWMVREAYSGYGVIQEIIANFKDYDTQAGLSQLNIVGDPTIRELIYTKNPLFTVELGQLIKGDTYYGIVVDIASGYSGGTSGSWESGGYSGWSGYSDGQVIVKFNTENEVFLVDEALSVGPSTMGAAVSCEPYKPFLEADYGWSAYSGYSATSGYSEWHASGWDVDGKYYTKSGWYSGISSYSIYPGYSGYSESKTDSY